jgi:hypothetical protein
MTDASSSGVQVASVDAAVDVATAGKIEPPNGPFQL